MGILQLFGIDIISKERLILENMKSGLKDSFHNIKDEIDEQKSWIKHIYNELSNHKDNVNNKIGKHEAHFDNISKWITYLDNSNKRLKKDMSQLEKNIYSRIKTDFLVFNEEIIKTIKMNSSREHINDLYKKIDLLQKRLDELENKQNDTKIGYISIEEKKDNIPSNLNKTQHKILNILYSSSIPLGYDTLAEKLNISVISARVYIKKLKDLGYGIETIMSGKKVLISISNKHKAKKFYNN